MSAVDEWLPPIDEIMPRYNRKRYYKLSMPKRGRSSYAGRPAKYRKRTPTRFRRGATSRRRFPKRSGRRPAGFKRMVSRLKWSGTDFPQTLLKKFTYQEVAPLAMGNTLGNSISGRIMYRMTDMYDPQGAIGGTSANHFSTFLNSSLYHNYYVLGTKVTLQFVNPGIYMVGIYCILCDDGDSNDYPAGVLQSDLDGAAMSANCRKVIYLNQSAGGAAIKTVSFYVNPWKFLGLTREQYLGNGGLLGYYNGTSSAPNWLNISAISMVDNTGTQIKVNTNIVYYAKLFNNSADPSASTPEEEGLLAEMDKDEVTITHEDGSTEISVPGSSLKNDKD